MTGLRLFPGCRLLDPRCQGNVSVLLNQSRPFEVVFLILLDFSLTVKATTLIFISGRGLAISSAKEGKSGFIYNLVKS